MITSKILETGDCSGHIKACIPVALYGGGQRDICCSQNKYRCEEEHHVGRKVRAF